MEECDERRQWYSECLKETQKVLRRLRVGSLGAYEEECTHIPGMSVSL